MSIWSFFRPYGDRGRSEPYDQRCDLAAFDAVTEANLAVRKAHREALSLRSKLGHSTGWRRRAEQALAMLGGQK